MSLVDLDIFTPGNFDVLTVDNNPDYNMYCAIPKPDLPNFKLNTLFILAPDDKFGILSYSNVQNLQNLPFSYTKYL